MHMEGRFLPVLGQRCLEPVVLSSSAGGTVTSRLFLAGILVWGFFVVVLVGLLRRG